MLLKLCEKNNSAADLQQVIDILNNSGIIIYPTGTIYAIGCHGLEEHVVERICQLKAIDPKKNNFSIICYDLSSISECAGFNNNTFRLMRRNLPGPLTFVLSGTVRLPKIFHNRKGVGIRIPDNPIIQELACFLDTPIMTITLSYERNEDVEYCTDPELIDEKFGNIVNLVIDSGAGDIESSTIVDYANGKAEVVRQGRDWLDEG